eukprot:6175981-Pleurochrysis_carterae.AAC.1
MLSPDLSRRSGRTSGPAGLTSDESEAGPDDSGGTAPQRFAGLESWNSRTSLQADAASSSDNTTGSSIDSLQARQLYLHGYRASDFSAN